MPYIQAKIVCRVCGTEMTGYVDPEDNYLPRQTLLEVTGHHKSTRELRGRDRWGDEVRLYGHENYDVSTTEGELIGDISATGERAYYHHHE